MSGDKRPKLLQDFKANDCAKQFSSNNTKIETIRTTNVKLTVSGSQKSIQYIKSTPKTDNIHVSTEEPVIVPLGGSSETGSLKTLCVRTCDGGFFPISQGAEPADFRRDARVCSMMCPGTQTELFYNSNMSETSEDMVSATTGKTYAKLKNAFAYRTRAASDGSQCGCNFSAYYREMMRREAELNLKKNLKKIKAGQSVISADMRAALLSEAGGLTPAPPVMQSLAPQRIRKVGPDFLPDESTVLDLKHPRNEAVN
jgi:hypothetical protein